MIENKPDLIQCKYCPTIGCLSVEMTNVTDCIMYGTLPKGSLSGDLFEYFHIIMCCCTHRKYLLLHSVLILL